MTPASTNVPRPSSMTAATPSSNGMADPNLERKIRHGGCVFSSTALGPCTACRRRASAFVKPAAAVSMCKPPAFSITPLLRETFIVSELSRTPTKARHQSGSVLVQPG